MRVNGFRCDTCSKEHLLEPYRDMHSWTDGVPGDWYVLWKGNPRNSQEEPFLLCSLLCLSQWITKQQTPVESESPYIVREEG